MTPPPPPKPATAKLGWHARRRDFTPAQVERNIFVWHEPAFRMVMEMLFEKDLTMHMAFFTTGRNRVSYSEKSMAAREIVFVTLAAFGATMNFTAKLTGCCMSTVRNAMIAHRQRLADQAAAKAQAATPTT